MEICVDEFTLKRPHIKLDVVIFLVIFLQREVSLHVVAEHRRNLCIVDRVTCVLIFKVVMTLDEMMLPFKEPDIECHVCIHIVLVRPGLAKVIFICKVSIGIDLTIIGENLLCHLLLVARHAKDLLNEIKWVI